MFDIQNLFSEDQAVTASAASTNVIDLGTAKMELPMELVIRVTETVTSGTGGSTVRFDLESDSAVGFATAKVIPVSSGDIVKTSLTAGTEVMRVKLPASVKRFNRIYYTCSANLTAGKFTAFLCKDRQTSQG